MGPVYNIALLYDTLSFLEMFYCIVYFGLVFVDTCSTKFLLQSSVKGLTFSTHFSMVS